MVRSGAVAVTLRRNGSWPLSYFLIGNFLGYGIVTTGVSVTRAGVEGRRRLTESPIGVSFSLRQTAPGL
jgi:hypothetical protein